MNDNPNAEDCSWCDGRGELPVIAPLPAGPCEDCNGTGRAPEVEPPAKGEAP